MPVIGQCSEQRLEAHGHLDVGQGVAAELHEGAVETGIRTSQQLGIEGPDVVSRGESGPAGVCGFARRLVAAAAGRRAVELATGKSGQGCDDAGANDVQRKC